MKKLHLNLTVIILSCLALLYSCSKSDFFQSERAFSKSKTDSLSIGEARAWFNQKHGEDRKLLETLSKKSKERLTSYLPGTFAGNPDWGMHLPYKGKQSLLIALDQTSGKYGRYSYRDIIITKDSTGKLKDYILEVKYDAAWIANQMKTKGARPNIRFYTNPTTFSGKVLLYTTSNFLIRGSIFKNGVLVSDIKPKRKAGGIGTVGMGGNLLKSYVRVGGEDDQTLEEVVVTNYVMLEEVIVYGHVKQEEPIWDYWWVYYLPDYNPYPPDYNNGYSGGGGGGSGGGGGYSPPPPPQDPCEDAKAGSGKATNLSKTEQYIKVLSDIKTAASDSKEHAISFGKDANGNIIVSNMVNGGSSSAPGTGTVQNKFAHMHNHPKNTPHSSGDIYGFFNTVQNNQSFESSYVVTTDGQVYALVLTNLEEMKVFNQNYPNQPPIPGYAPEFPEELVNEMNKMKQESSATEEMALAFIFEKYKAGVALLKLNENGEFKRLNTKETIDQNGEKTYIPNNCK